MINLANYQIEELFTLLIHVIYNSCVIILYFYIDVPFCNKKKTQKNYSQNNK